MLFMYFDTTSTTISKLIQGKNTQNDGIVKLMGA
jgi:hypothetical protein